MLLMLLGMVFMSGGLYVDSMDPACDESDYPEEATEEEPYTSAQCLYKK